MEVKVSELEKELLAALEELIKWVKPSGYAPRRYDDAMAKAKAAVLHAKDKE